MSRKRINDDAVLTPAEKQKRHREKRKAERAELLQIQSKTPDMVALKKQIIAEYEASKKAQWDNEIKNEKAKEIRNATRQKEQGKYYRRGFIHCICRVCFFFEKRGRHDIAHELLKEFRITQADFENPDNDVHKLLRDDLQQYGLFPLKLGE